MSDMHEGGCLCGAVRYRITAEPVVQCYCCCETCRGATGAPTVSWIAVPERGFEVTQGAMTRYESSANVWREFCPTCGTAISYRNGGYPDDRFEADDLVAVTSSSLDDIEAFPPNELFHDDELPDWLPADQLCPGAKRHHPKAAGR